MEGTVQKRFTSKKGTPCLEIGGQVYIAPKVDISNVQVGDKLDFQGHSFGDGKMWELDGFRLTSAAVKYPQQQGTNAAIPGTSVGCLPIPLGVTEAERLTISNWVAAAIQSGVVKDPADMGIWAHAACEAIRSAGKSGEIP